MSEHWRFISYEEHTAAYNMAADEAILNAHLAGVSAPTLRIYGFRPAALSLGANQKLPPVILQRAHAAGFDIVRRPSGGRAVLHLGDLTYSFVGTAANYKDKTTREKFLFPSINGAYRQICRGLILAFKRLGLVLEFGAKHTAGMNSGVNCGQDCFAAITGGDLQVNGLKVVGSAQLRRKAAVLQHGTIILRQDPSIMQNLLRSAQPQLRHANLYDLLGRELSKQELETSILQGFQDAFEVSFRTGRLSEKEKKEARQASRAAKFVHCD